MKPWMWALLPVGIAILVKVLRPKASSQVVIPADAEPVPMPRFEYSDATPEAIQRAAEGAMKFVDGLYGHTESLF